jgi:hypothetical protein
MVFLLPHQFFLPVSDVGIHEIVSEIKIRCNIHIKYSFYALASTEYMK